MEKNGKKIVIIDDEEMLLGPLVELFEAEGFEVGSAKDGEEGLKKVTEVKPDIVIVDLTMPKMDGLTMLSKLRGIEGEKNIPVIIFTNTSDAEKINKAIEGGANEFLIKADWKLGDLIKKVKDKLGVK